MQVEAQSIGLLAHQVMSRPGPWRPVGGGRFVPPGGDASSAIYMQWRREGSAWVIDEFGDERFKWDNVLDWCC